MTARCSEDIRSSWRSAPRRALRNHAARCARARRGSAASSPVRGCGASRRSSFCSTADGDDPRPTVRRRRPAWFLEVMPSPAGRAPPSPSSSRASTSSRCGCGSPRARRSPSSLRGAGGRAPPARSPPSARVSATTSARGRGVRRAARRRRASRRRALRGLRRLARVRPAARQGRRAPRDDARGARRVRGRLAAR